MWEGRVSKTSAAVRPGWVVPLGMINKSINILKNLTKPGWITQWWLLNADVFSVVTALHPGGEERPPEPEIGQFNSLHIYNEEIIKIQKKEKEKRAKRVHDYIYTRDSLLVYITWDIQLKTALTFKNIIIEGTELSGGISLTLWSVFGIWDWLLTKSGKSRASSFKLDL